MIIQKQAFARAGLIGNPSDGYFGKTISAIIKNFRAEVTLYESPELVIVPSRRDELMYGNMADMVDDIHIAGYYGGIRLVKAAIKKFHDHLVANKIPYENKSFTIRYESNIPMRVGMAGSSAIITAVMRALMEFYGVEISKEALPTLILRVETEELGISAGLQDRVIQVYGGCVYMDFDKDLIEKTQHGRYEELDPRLLPPLYVAYRKVLAEGTEVVHNDLRARWNQGDPAVHEGMRKFAALTDEFRDALLQRDLERLSATMNANFDLRASLMKISEANWQLINTARSVGVCAKFCGSGGAIVGICMEDKTFNILEEAMKEIGAELVRVQVV